MEVRGIALNTVKDIDELMVQLREARKEMKEKEKNAVKELREAKKAENAEKAKARLVEAKEGDVLTVIFKGEEVEGTFIKMTEKRFIVLIDEQKKTIMFDKLV